jgi:hypothetical protein
MDPRHSSIWLFRKAASELVCKHALVSAGSISSEASPQTYES